MQVGEGPLHLWDQANETPVKVQHKHMAAHEENLILSNTKVKLIDLILCSDPQNGLLYHVPMQTFSPFTKRTESSALCRQAAFQRLSYYKTGSGELIHSKGCTSTEPCGLLQRVTAVESNKS